MAETYNQGQVDAIEMWGRVCGSKSDCDDCAIKVLRGEELSCQEFASQFPKKFLSLLSEMYNDRYTYYDEYITRFPACNMSIEDLSKCACRKALFEGYTDCDKTNCTECWNEEYTGDVTEETE